MELLTPSPSAIAPGALLVWLALFVHSIPEGAAIGVGYSTGEVKFGWLLAVAIAVHNIPEGLAISLVMIPRGVPVWQAALWSIFTSLPQPIMAVPLPGSANPLSARTDFRSLGV